MLGFVLRERGHSEWGRILDRYQNSVSLAKLLVVPVADYPIAHTSFPTVPNPLVPTFSWFGASPMPTALIPFLPASTRLTVTHNHPSWISGRKSFYNVVIRSVGRQYPIPSGCIIPCQLFVPQTQRDITRRPVLLPSNTHPRVADNRVLIDTWGYVMPILSSGYSSFKRYTIAYT